ncbi:MAG: M14 family metallopeptidase [Armatimonadota bacterium]
MRRAYAVIGLSVLVVLLWAQKVDYSGYQVLRVQLTSLKQLAELEELVRDIWTCHPRGRTVDVCVSPKEREQLRKAGYQWEVLIEDVGALIREQESTFQPQGGDIFSRYLPLQEVYAVMRSLAEQNPHLVQLLQIGRSIEGRPIYALRLTKDPRRARVYRHRPQVVLNACQHAREWITVAVALYLAHRLCAEYGIDTRVTELLQRTEVYIVPVVNPDGYEYSWTTDRLWRKNRRYLGIIEGRAVYGVDLNRNWGYQWGGEGASRNPRSETYRGTAPFSEPETYFLSQWMSTLPLLRAHIDIHSYSQLIMWPWGYTNQLAPHDYVFRRVGLEMQSLIFSVHGMFYNAGPIYTTIYPASGNAVDWVYGMQGALSFAYELRDTGQYGFLLPPDQIRPNGEEIYPAVLRLIQWAWERRWD